MAWNWAFLLVFLLVVYEGICKQAPLAKVYSRHIGLEFVELRPRIGDIFSVSIHSDFG